MAFIRLRFNSCQHQSDHQEEMFRRQRGSCERIERALTADRGRVAASSRMVLGKRLAQDVSVVRIWHFHNFRKCYSRSFGGRGEEISFWPACQRSAFVFRIFLKYFHLLFSLMKDQVFESLFWTLWLSYIQSH